MTDIILYIHEGIWYFVYTQYAYYVCHIMVNVHIVLKSNANHIDELRVVRRTVPKKILVKRGVPKKKNVLFQ